MRATLTPRSHHYKAVICQDSARAIECDLSEMEASINVTGVALREIAMTSVVAGNPNSIIDDRSKSSTPHANLES